ncbi:hypothetical protein MBLNU457_4372t1 [Dothideomycetes sp. NU457]
MPAYSTRNSSHTLPASRQASSPRANPPSISQIAVNTTMSCQAQPFTLDSARTDTKKMSPIHNEEETHDHENDSAYGSAASPSMTFSTLSHQQTKHTTPPSSHSKFSSCTSNQPYRPPLPHSQNHPTISSSLSRPSNRLFDNPNSLDYPHLARPGYGYSVTITGNVNYARKSESRQRPRSSGSQKITKQKKRDSVVASPMPTPTPEEVFGLAPVNCGVGSRGIGGGDGRGGGGVESGGSGGGGGGGVGMKVLSAYERRMAKRDRFTLALIRGQGSRDEA